MKKAIVLAICVLMAVPVISMAYDETVEPNNDFSHATLLKESARGTVGFDDTTDIYRFYVAEGLEIRLELVGNNDVDLYLYNPEQQGVAYSCNEFYEYIAYQSDMTGYWYAEVTTARGSADYTLTATLLLDQHDGGYEGDAGDKILKPFALFPMEPHDGVAGRVMSGTLSPPGDAEDWYYFSVGEGQTVSITLTPEDDYDLEFVDNTATVLASSTNSGTSAESISYEVTNTAEYYMRIFAKEGAGEGDYTMTIDLQGENDGGQGKDAGDTPESAMTITPGTYPGFLSYYDQVDWYAFSVSSGQGIHVELETPLQSDYNLYLYDPDGEFVHSATYYSDDVLEYPADKSGTWKLKVDIFPGYDEKWDTYPLPIFKYGSGPYILTLELGGSVSAPPVTPQPDIVPVAQTIVVDNDDGSNMDEYNYMAAVPAANYVEGGTRYVSPVVYEGDDTITNWFGTVDDTTDYLLEDWNAYLANHGKEASVYTMTGDPVSAAAALAEHAWESSSDAVVVVDGSAAEDGVTEVLSQSATLNIQTSVKQTRGDSDDFIEIDGNAVFPFWVGRKWGIMHVELTEVKGVNYEVEVITPRYSLEATDWWPDEGHGEEIAKDDIWHPIQIPGPYGLIPSSQGDFLLSATLYSCDRYRIPVDNPESKLSVTIETDEPSYLWVYLIDPRGNIVAPPLPSWSGAEIPPPKVMPGNVSQGTEEEFDHLVVEPHTTFTAEVSYPIPGTYTAIVVPREDMSGSISYNIKAEIHEFNANSRVDYALAAANGAVEASLKHAPLLYTASDGLSEETLRALNNLGVKKVTFIDFAGTDAVAEELAANFEVEHLTTMKEVTQSIKALKSSQALALENDDYLTVTSFASGDGYYAPTSYIAAYHGAPVADIGAMGEAYHWGTVTQLWMFYSGDWYHGSRSLGHLAMASQPIMDYIRNGELPPIGWDAELQWFSKIVEAVYTYADSIGMDRSGLETYTFVAPKTDICFTVHHALLGNESTAGQFIGKTPGESAAYVSRSVLYPAIIFANPYRNITTSSLMNFRDGNGARGNDGVQYYAYTSRNIARLFGAFGREYRGHCAWDNLVVDQNRASLYYYSGHGTGGGGVSYHPDNWAGKTVGLGGYDAWRGYQYWQGKTPRSGGFVWYNVEGETYNLYHFKWCDRDWQNLHSQFVGWMSCTTFAHLGPEVYLEHGAVFGFGNANTGLSPHWEIHDLYFFQKALYEGKSIGEAYSETVWRFERDFTTMDPTSVYGSFSMIIDSDQVLYGDPSIYIYSPLHWTEPEPVDGF